MQPDPPSAPQLSCRLVLCAADAVKRERERKASHGDEEEEKGCQLSPLSFYSRTAASVRLKVEDGSVCEEDGHRHGPQATEGQGPDQLLWQCEGQVRITACCMEMKASHVTHLARVCLSGFKMCHNTAFHSSLLMWGEGNGGANNLLCQIMVWTRIFLAQECKDTDYKKKPFGCICSYLLLQRNYVFAQFYLRAPVLTHLE